MSELKPCQMDSERAIAWFENLIRSEHLMNEEAASAIKAAIDALRRAQPDNEPLMLPDVPERDYKSLADGLHDVFAEWAAVDWEAGLMGMSEGETVLANAIMALLCRKPNVPLTLDELRGMDEESVYIVCGNPKDELNGCFVVVQEEMGTDENGEVVTGPALYNPRLYGEHPEEAFYGMKCDRQCEGMGCQHGLHQFGWLAYRHEPEGGDHDA